MVRFRRRRTQSIVGAPMRWVTARIKWEAAGKPVRSDTEVRRIHDEICKPCEHYAEITPTLGRCKLCQCSLNLGSTLNKIRWSTESCPAGKWQAEVETEEKKTDTAGRAIAVPVRQVGLPREIIQQMTPEERLAEHERRKLQRREARRLAAKRDTEDTSGT